MQNMSIIIYYRSSNKKLAIERLHRASSTHAQKFLEDNLSKNTGVKVHEELDTIWHSRTMIQDTECSSIVTVSLP